MQEAIKITLKRERPWKKENYNTADSWELREIEEERMETDEGTYKCIVKIRKIKRHCVGCREKRKQYIVYLEF